MSEKRELKWRGPQDGKQWLSDFAKVWDRHEIGEAGWTAYPGTYEMPDGPETGAAGRRAAENALVDAGVITRAEADALVSAEINEQPDESLPGSVGMTPSELGAWVVRNFECPECCDSGCSECKGAMFPPPGYSARDCEACDFRAWIKDGDTMCTSCSEWGDELIGEVAND